MNATRTGLTVKPNRPATKAQTDYIRDLLAKVTGNAEPIRQALNTHRERGTLTIEVASMAITSLKALIANQGASPAPAIDPVREDSAVVVQAREARAQRPYPVVAAGRYAVEVDGSLRWYNVTVEGGRVYAKRYVSDNLTRISAGEAVRALRLIEADPKAAALRFAAASTRCYVCGRRLTDTTEGGSVDKGIGPDCEARGLGY